KEDLIKSKLVGLLEHGKDEPIAELTLETLVKAIYIGYEVEETFEVGDWVVRTDEGIKYKGELYRKGRLFKIYRIDENLDCPVICEEMGGHSKKTLRHA